MSRAVVGGALAVWALVAVAPRADAQAIAPAVRDRAMPAWPGVWQRLRPGAAALRTEREGAELMLPATGPVRLELNLPAHELRMLDTLDRPVAAWPVAIGMRSYPTPRGDFALTQVILNPWWHPPESPWAEHDRVTPPGPRSPVGRLKATFAPLLHFHGTPLRGSIGGSASHGCVRLGPGDIVLLGRLLLAQDPRARAAAPDADPIVTRLDSWKRTTQWTLQRPVPVQIRYSWLEQEPDGTLRIYPDPYKRLTLRAADSLAAVLREAGSGEMTGAAIRRLIAQAGRRESWVRVSPEELDLWIRDGGAGAAAR